jgi:hypothetical protein
MSIATITDLWRMSATELAEAINPSRFPTKGSSRRICDAPTR